MVEFQIFLENVNEKVQCVSGYEYSSGKQKMCTWGNEGSWGMMKTFFPDANQINFFQKLFYAKNVHMLKKIYMKVMRILFPHQIINLPFHHQFSGRTYS